MNDSNVVVDCGIMLILLTNTPEDKDRPLIEINKVTVEWTT